MPASVIGGQSNSEEIVHGSSFKAVTTKLWTELISDRLEWCVEALTTNPTLYTRFRDLANAHRAADSEKRFGVEHILQRLRWDTNARQDGDMFKLNNNLRPLFARLYLSEYPDAQLEIRKSWLDLLHPSEWSVIIDAFVSVGGVIAVRDGESA